MSQPTSEYKVKPEVVRSFLSRTASVRTFMNDQKRATEHCMSLNLAGVVKFYEESIGIGPVLTSWDEIRACLSAGMDQAKRTKPDGAQFSVRLFGDCKPWLAIKIYTFLLYQCDHIYYGGDVLIRL